MSWQLAGELAGTLAVGSVVLRGVPQRRLRRFAPVLFEAAILALLYAMWQVAGMVSVTGATGAKVRAEWIERFDRRLPLPSELSVNHAILGHRLITEAANLYYATMHFPTMFAFLIWLFVRHRDRYRPVRATMAWATLGCLLVQLMPVAPPRMLPGFVDTAKVYGQSVYATGLAADQLSAMPSVHVAWALVVGYYTVRIGRSRWRWAAAAHPVLTVLVVVATANHWWLDGIVAAAVLVACAWLRHGSATAVRAAITRLRPAPAPPAPTPESATTGASG